MKYDCYKGGKHIGDLKVGSRSVLAVCKGGKPVWRRPHEFTLTLGTSNFITTEVLTGVIPCDCTTLSITGTARREASGYCTLHFYINGVEKFTVSPGGAYQSDYSKTVSGTFTKGDVVKIDFAGSKYGTGKAVITSTGFHTIPKS